MGSVEPLGADDWAQWHTSDRWERTLEEDARLLAHCLPACVSAVLCNCVCSSVTVCSPSCFDSSSTPFGLCMDSTGPSFPPLLAAPRARPHGVCALLHLWEVGGGESAVRCWPLLASAIGCGATAVALLFLFLFTSRIVWLEEVPAFPLAPFVSSSKRLMLPVLCACVLAVAATVLAAAWWSVNRVPAFRIAGCCALVTGGSAGIGLETARHLVRRQAKIVIIAARRADILQAAVEDLRGVAGANGTQVLHVVMDVGDEASVLRAVDEVKHLTAHTGGVDLVVCNAGFAIPARFVDMTPAESRRIMDVNFFGCVHVVRAMLPDMLQRRRGRIVLVSSLAARCPIAGYSVYGASKAAVRALAHSLDMENSCMGVRFQVVSPPDVETPGLQTEDLRKSPECRAISSFGGTVPLKADAMGRRIVEGIVDYRFDVFVGTDSTLLGWGAAGIEPATNLPELLAQFFLNGWLRLVMAVFSKLHYGIVRRVRTDEKTTADGKKQA